MDRPSIVPTDYNYTIVWRNGEDIPLLPLLFSDDPDEHEDELRLEAARYLHKCIYMYSTRQLTSSTLPWPLANVFNSAHNDPLIAESYCAFAQHSDHYIPRAAKLLVFTLYWRALRYSKGQGVPASDVLDPPRPRRDIKTWRELEQCHAVFASMEEFVTRQGLCIGSSERVRFESATHMWVGRRELLAREEFENVPNNRDLHKFVASVVFIQLTRLAKIKYVRIKL